MVEINKTKYRGLEVMIYEQNPEKPVNWVSDNDQHKPGCTAKEDS